jgi:hypothetical protein
MSAVARWEGRTLIFRIAPVGPDCAAEGCTSLTGSASRIPVRAPMGVQAHRELPEPGAA